MLPGAAEDLRLLGPCCKLFIVKKYNSVRQPCRSPDSGGEIKT